MNQSLLPMKTLICPECGSLMILRDSKHGKFYGCSTFPVCKGTHSAHQSTGEPMGIPGDAETKQLRMEAHRRFDSLWNGGMISREDAYRWLQNAMRLSKKAAHIGSFTKEQCQTLVNLLKETHFVDKRKGKTEMAVAFERAQAKGESQ